MMVPRRIRVPSTYPYLDRTIYGLPDEMLLGLAAVFRMVTFPSPNNSEVEGTTFTAWPANEAEERAIVEAVIGVFEFYYERMK